VLHDVLKQVVKCSDRHVFTLVGKSGTKLIVYKNMPCQHSEAVLLFHL
jgi:hypothetical protein